MSKETIKVYCRVKPVLGISTTVEYDLENNRSNGNGGAIEFFVPDDFNIRHTHNRSTSYKFRFNDVFDQEIDQEQVFEDVAKPILDNCLNGFNGTVFVYGQTATGKTYTITGKEADEKQKRQSPRKKTRRKKSKQEKPSSSTVDEKPSSSNTPATPQDAIVPEVSEEEKPIELETIPETEETNIVSSVPEENIVPQTPIKTSIISTHGIVPRTLSYLFSYFSDYEAECEVAVSYYEIYREIGYDLLNGLRQRRRAVDLSQLSQIKAMTDARHNLHLKNLSRHIVRNEREALEFLEHGNENRQVAETHLNDASSRSHCIFTIHLTIKHPETEKTLQSKINLVDLAGSERIGKSHERNDKIMAEGRNINLSLHHLQQVIVSLSRKKATIQHHRHHHVPYRNSTMTLILRDSLGGTSYTSMIATVSAEEKNLEESISTCRFAQQVATISNKVVINETLDSDLIIARLQQELQETKQQLEIALLSTTPNQSIADNIEDLAERIQKYLEDGDENAQLDAGSNNDDIQFCFNDLKKRLLEQLNENRRLQEEAAAVKNKKSKTCMIM